MKVTQTATYALAPSDVLAILAAQEFQEEKCRATYAESFEASVTESGSSTVVTTARSMPTEHLPDVARGFIGNSLTIHETQTWTGPDAAGGYTADLKLHVQGAPMTGSGRRTLSPDGNGGSTDNIAVEIKASIPLIGRRIEEMAAPMVSAAAEIETELLKARSR